jgi:hypothetical protein
MQLAAYQDAFAQALLAEHPAVPPQLDYLVAQPGFAVYRNTVLKGCIDALHANFPAVARVVGDEWFRAAAAVYARRAPPGTPTLLTYGQSFPDFLAHFEPAAELPYLAAVARADRLWSESHVAADDAALDPATLARITIEDMDRITLRPHAAARWTWCDEHPVYTLWSRNRAPGAEFDAPFGWRGEGLLLTRPHGAVDHYALPCAGVAFLAACAAGLSVARAVAAAVEAEPGADLAALINQFLRAGALADLQTMTCKDD